jgi:signal transduction histidine kinase
MKLVWPSGESFLAQFRKRDYFFQTLKVSLGLVIAFILCQFPLYYLEFYGYDLMHRLRPATPPSGQVAIVAIDSRTLGQLNRPPHLNEHTEVLRKIYLERPRAVIYLENPKLVRGDTGTRTAFAHMAKAFPFFSVSIPDLEVDGNSEKFQLPKPLHTISTHQGILSEDKVNFGGDGVSRRGIISYENKWFIHPLAAQTITGPKNVSDYKGVFDFKGSQQVLVNMHPKDSFPRTSFFDVMQGRFAFGTFANKVVIVGKASDYDSPDFVRSVYSRDIAALPTIEYHANIIDTLITDTAITQAPNWLNLLITAIISLLAVFFTFRLSPLKGLMFILITATVFVGATFSAFWFLGFWINLAHPLLAIFITYYFFIPYRLIAESRRSWEYQQKNQLLTQVEELKNNFISMMSHDLKTPIARIQGMAEMALSNLQNPNDKPKDALQSICNSTEELTIFINSILNLSRVESKGVKLQLESKDINTLVKEVVEKNQFQADKKNIQILFEPEPLFSIKVDVDLMRQVIHNVIENAIKYSPENSKVLITTEEVSGEIQLQVSDQGMGISTDEVDKIFYKFYRSKNAKTSPIKGSGLGLYLSDYFVKLHNGKIQVESVPEQGSTFTVSLPI